MGMRSWPRGTELSRCSVQVGVSRVSLPCLARCRVTPAPHARGLSASRQCTVLAMLDDHDRVFRFTVQIILSSVLGRCHAPAAAWFQVRPHRAH